MGRTRDVVADLVYIVGGGLVVGMLVLGACLMMYTAFDWIDNRNASRAVLDLHVWTCTDREPDERCYEYRLDHMHAMNGSAKR